jgi:hypothetical protein
MEVRIMRRMIGFLMMVGLVIGVVGFVGCGEDDENPTSSEYVCNVSSNKDQCVGCSYDELKAASSLSSACQEALRLFEKYSN